MPISSSTLTQLAAMIDPQPATVSYMNSVFSTLNAYAAQLFSDLSTTPAASNVTGTAAQITATPSGQTVTLSLPAAITLPGSLTLSGTQKLLVGVDPLSSVAGGGVRTQTGNYIIGGAVPTTWREIFRTAADQA